MTLLAALLKNGRDIFGESDGLRIFRRTRRGGGIGPKHCGGQNHESQGEQLSRHHNLLLEHTLHKPPIVDQSSDANR